MLRLLVLFIIAALLHLPHVMEAAETPAQGLSLTARERAWLADHPSIRIGAMDSWPPMDFVDEHGVASGIGADYVAALNNLLGGVLEIVPAPFADNLQKIKDGELDALLDITPKPEREEFLNFTSPYLIIPHVIVTRESDRYFAKEEDLRNTTLALEKGFYSVDYFRNTYPDITVAEYPNTALALDAVARGEADAYAGNRAVATWIMEEEIITNLQVQGRLNRPGSVLAIGVRKDWPELAAILEKALHAIPDNETHAIRRHWTGLATGQEAARKQLTLSHDERAFVAYHQPLRFSEVPWEPLSVITDDGRFDGMIADYLNFVADISGLRFTFLKSDTWADVLGRYRIGDIDLIPAIDKNDNAGRAILFSEPFLTFPLVIVTRDNVSFIAETAELNDRTVAVGRGYTSFHFLRQNYPAVELVEVDDVREGLLKVARNEVFAFVGHLAVAVDAMQQLGLKNLKIAGETEYRFEHRIGVDPAYPLAVSIINKAIEQLSEDESRAIYRRWLEVEYAKGIDYSLVWKVGAGASLFILLVLFWNQRLSGEIARRKAVEQELIANERKIRAMADASHDSVVMINSKGIVRFWNRAAERMFGISAADALGRPMHDIIVPETDRQAAMLGLGDFATTGRGKVVGNVQERLAKHSDNTLFPVEIAISSFQLGEGWYAVGVIRDITERVRTQQERDEAFETINSSINYASNIQNALLPTPSLLDKCLGDHFIVWQPRDRVGGDIYFCKPFGPGRIIALGDCTGHGVPGAFMTMIANGALEMALLETPPGEVGRLLSRTHQLIQQMLDQDTAGGLSDDGMEMGICYLPPRGDTLGFAGARFSLYTIQKGGVFEIKGERNGIGYRDVPPGTTFTKHQVDLAGVSSIYLTTDGLIDQVGGPRRRSFGKKRFKELLLALEEMPIHKRGGTIIENLQEYQGHERRRDDVAVLGFSPASQGLQHEIPSTSTATTAI